MERQISARPTVFKAVTYRSQTEARWAVFFDHLEVTFTYEPDSITLDDGTKYLPDFFVEDFNAYLEVKPDNKGIVLAEAEKALAAYQQGHAERMFLLIGSPILQHHSIVDFRVHGRWSNLQPYATLKEYVEDESLRFTFAEDRRDDGVYWLLAKDDLWSAHAVGGWGKWTDHPKPPLVKGRVKEAYALAAKAFR